MVSLSKWRVFAVVTLAATVLSAVRRLSQRVLKSTIVISSSEADVEHYVAAMMSLFPNVPVQREFSRARDLEVFFVSVKERIFVGKISQPDDRMYRSIPGYIQRKLDELLQSPIQVDGVAVHETAFAWFMHIPAALCTTISAPTPRRISREHFTTRLIAELYLTDILIAKDDLLLCESRVVDDVVAASLRHHETPLLFAQVLQSTFGVDVGERPLIDCLLSNRMLFMSASLTAAGSNRLEMVFGAPALWFTFLQCSSDSVLFVKELFDIVSQKYGWDYINFARMINDMFGHDRPEIVRHSPRIFRALNKSRSGSISLDELCAWLARKLSTRTSKHPDQHLLSTLMSLRLPFVLFMDKKDLWPRMECSVKSLSDDDVHI